MEGARPPGTLGFGPPILQPVDHISYPPFAYALSQQQDLQCHEDVEAWEGCG